MRRDFSSHVKSWWYLLAIPMLVLLLAGCSTTASTTPTAGAGGTPTASGSSTATPSGSSGSSDSGSSGSGSGSAPTAPQHAFAWTQYTSGSTPTPQIWASINGGAAYQVTHLSPITDGCDTQISWGLPVFSPNLSKIVTSLGSFNCGDGPMTGPVDIVNASNGAITTVPGGSNSYVRSSDRTEGWINNNTIFFVNGTGLYTYTLGSSSTTHLSGVTNPEEAVLRGSTLFWSQVTFSTGTNNWTTTLHRYDINTHSALSGSIALGQAHNCQCSPGDFLLQGWDASPDGSHVAYQVTTPLSGGNLGVASSHIYYAHADGSGASQIATYMVTNQTVRMQISPNGQLVAFAAALPSPSVITASVSSPGGSSDPNFHSYTPDGFAYPVWKWTSASFWVGNRVNGDFESPGTKALYYHTVGTSAGAIGVNGGFNPWYTIV